MIRFPQVAAEPEDETLRPQLREDEVADQGKAGQPRGGVEFEDQGRVVAVQDQSGKTVALAIDEAETGGCGIGKALAPGEGRPESSAPEGRVDRDRVSGMDDAHPQGGGGVVEPHGEETIVAVVDHGHSPDSPSRFCRRMLSE